MADLLSTDEESRLLDELAASTAADAVRYAADVDRLARLAILAGAAEAAVLDVAGTLRIGQQAAALRLHHAERLSQMLPLTLAGLREGRLLVPQARILLEETANCSLTVAAEAERRVLDGLGEAELAGWFGSRLTRRVKRAVLAAESALKPEHTGERERTARNGRRVSVRPEPDGMAGLWALLPAEQMRVFTLGLDELTRRQRLADRDAGVERTADQRRADLFAMLPALALHALDGTLPPADGGSSAVVVNVHVPMATALGLSDEPGELQGYGPISAGCVRLMLPDATLRRVLADARTGEVLHVDARTSKPASSTAARRTASLQPPGGKANGGGATGGAESARSDATGDDATAGQPTGSDASRNATNEILRRALLAMLDDEPVLIEDVPEPQYRPSQPLTRLVKARDLHCVGIGCSLHADAVTIDLDHRTPWPIGPTSAGNLAPLSRRCHRAKTLGWSLRRHADGNHLWTSPAGRSYWVPGPWHPPSALRPPRPPVPAPRELRPATQPDEPETIIAQLDEAWTGQDVKLRPAPVDVGPTRRLEEDPPPF